MSISLDSPVSDIKGVGPKATASLAKCGIFTVRDLLYYLPRTYENYQTSTAIRDVHPGRVVVRGKITDLKVNYTNRKNLNITEGTIYDETDAIKAVWFNQPYRAKQFDPDKEYLFSGSYDLTRGRYQLTSPKAKLYQEVEQNPDASFRPIYRSKGTFKSENFEKIIKSLRSEFSFIPNLLPLTDSTPDFIKNSSRAESLFKVHFAEGPEDAESGRTYLAYEELFEMILASNLNKQENSKLSSIPLPFNQKNTKGIISKLPFSLTNAQRKATWEILQDLEKGTPMNRLLQGDVGSGKTIVAALAAHQAVMAGHQVALLAPTAILATQHAEGLREILEPFGIRICLLIGSTKNKPRIKQDILDGKYNLIIGTHALITDDTRFRSLALCIIDEQHRFGVGQRQKLLAKTSHTDASPHLLSMSATPIPRSLQLAIFGDLSVSILNELPAGRQPIATKIVSDLALTDIVYPKVREYLAKGQQVYWICKTIEGKTNSTSTSVKKMADRLEEVFPHARIGRLNGRMKPEEKDSIMTDFATGKIDILVSTTVVEVGVNVPNANLMIIMDSEDYGLAQIHQLRGRIGRGHDAAECFLVMTGDNQPTKRLKELESFTDGFHLAEVDLKIRGPGEIYGALQHGALNLNIATLADTRLIKAAATEVRDFIKNPDYMLQYKELSETIKKYQQLTTLN